MKKMATIGQRYDSSNCPKIKCKIQRNEDEMQRNAEKCRGIQRNTEKCKEMQSIALSGSVLYVEN